MQQAIIYNHHHWTSMGTVECTMQQYISAPYMLSLQALTEVANLASCIIVASCIGTRAGPDLVDCGGGSSCLLLLHPSLTCTDPGP